jgi:hypothetical protein
LQAAAGGGEQQGEEEGRVGCFIDDCKVEAMWIALIPYNKTSLISLVLLNTLFA